jgi:hypothetical protein
MFLLNTNNFGRGMQVSQNGFCGQNHKNTNPQTKKNKTVRNQITTKRYPNYPNKKRIKKEKINKRHKNNKEKLATQNMCSTHR